MIKHLKIIFFMLLIGALYSCKGNQDVSKPSHAVTLDLTVQHEDWSFDDNARQFFYHFEVGDITSEVYNYGNWTISREFNAGTRDAYQVALPMSIFCSDTLQDNSIVYYTQYIDYRLGAGWVEVQLTNSDYIYFVDKKGQPVKPEDMLFRLQLIY